MTLEILHGPEQYLLPQYLLAKLQPARPEAAAVRTSVGDAASSGPARKYSEVYSTKHETILLRLDHVERMDDIRRDFNRRKVHTGQRSLTTSDLVNGCLDFVFEHSLPFQQLMSADEVRPFVADHVRRDVVSRWKQWNEVF